MPLLFTETWKPTPTAVLLSQAMVANPDLLVKVYGPAAPDLNLANSALADLTPGSGHGFGGYSSLGFIEVYGNEVSRR